MQLARFLLYIWITNADGDFRQGYPGAANPDNRISGLCKANEYTPGKRKSPFVYSKADERIRFPAILP